MVYFIFVSGDRAQALRKILQLVEWKSKFLEEFIMEGLRFNSSMYLSLIWLEIFRNVLKNPRDVKKKLNPILISFADFFNNPTRDNYVQGLINDMSKLTITPQKHYTVKRKLSESAEFDDSEQDMAYIYQAISSNDEIEMPEPPKKKKSKKNKKSNM